MTDRRALLLAAALVAVMSACAPDPPQPGTEKPAPLADDEVRLTPLPLFRGDAERLEPHLGLASSAAVKVDFKGERLPVFAQFVVRHNGKVIKTQDAVTARLDGPAEVTFSLREVSPPPKGESVADGEVLYKAVAAAGSTATGWSFKRPALKEDVGFVASDRAGKPATVKRGEEFDLWGMYAGKETGLTKRGESLSARAERVEWSVVLRVCLRERPEDK